MADRASPFLFSAAEANAVCTFVEQLPHVEGRSTTDTIRLEPWHLHPRGVLRFRRRPDGRRLVTTVFFQVARKSAKSTLVAAVALYHLTVEREPGGQVVYATSTGQQARIVFNIAHRMVRRSRWLREQGLQVQYEQVRQIQIVRSS